MAMKKTSFNNTLLATLEEYDKMKNSIKEISEKAYEEYSSADNMNDLKKVNIKRRQNEETLIPIIALEDIIAHLEGCSYRPNMFLAKVYGTYLRYSNNYLTRFNDIGKQISLLTEQSNKLFDDVYQNGTIEVKNTNSSSSQPVLQNPQQNLNDDDNNNPNPNPVSENAEDDEEDIAEQKLSMLEHKRFKINQEIKELEERERDLLESNNKILTQILKLNSAQKK